MASVLHKLLKKPSSSRPLDLLSYFASSRLRELPLLPFLRDNPVSLTNPSPNPPFPCPLDKGGGGGGESPSLFHQSLCIYPSFPYSFILEHTSGFNAFDTENDCDGGPGKGDCDRTVWADSVKKKRRRKMNKHKYRKRRKRLRRKKKS